MKLVMTLLARDEADIVDAQIAFHLNAGVDFVIATDNRSSDGTTEILERTSEQGDLRLIREAGEDLRQAEWVTRMARLAASEHGADWVINSDADEFWWPREGSLKDVLAAIPDGSASCVVPGATSSRGRTTDRSSPSAWWSASRARRTRARRGPCSMPTRRSPTARRATCTSRSGTTTRSGRAPAAARLAAIEIFHFSFRTVAQVEKKGRGGWWSRPAPDLAEHIALLGRAAARGASRSICAASRSTTRLFCGTGRRHPRDRHAPARRAPALAPRRRHVRASRSRRSAASRRHPTPQQDAEFAAEVAPLAEIDGVVRAEERVGGSNGGWGGSRGARRVAA